MLGYDDQLNQFQKIKCMENFPICKYFFSTNIKLHIKQKIQ